MNQADVQYRFRVICDLNIQEYEEQRHLAETDPSWHRPSIELFRKLPPHQRINEDHIGSIATDAWAAATNAAATNLDMSDQDLQMFKQAAVSWPTEQKLHFLRAAAEHWMPPYQDETLWWQHNARSATEFLYQFPEIQQPLYNWPREPQELLELQREFQTQQNNPQSPRRTTSGPGYSSPRQNQPLRMQDRSARQNEREANQQGRALGSTGCAALL